MAFIHSERDKKLGQRENGEVNAASGHRPGVKPATILSTSKPGPSALITSHPAALEKHNVAKAEQHAEKQPD